MLAYGQVFTYGKEVDAAYKVISYNANQVSKRMHTWFGVVEQLHQDIILGFNWLQGVNSQVDWVNCGSTVQNSFVAVVSVHHYIKFKLCSFIPLLYLFCTNKLVNNWCVFIQKVFRPQRLNSGLIWALGGENQSQPPRFRCNRS